MSLRPQQPLPPVPNDTARIARAAFRRGNPYMLLRDRLGAVFDDVDFADLYPALGQPAYAPWRLALVTLMQFREGLSDRQAAEAVRGRSTGNTCSPSTWPTPVSTTACSASSAPACSGTKPPSACLGACWTPPARAGC